MNCEVRYSGTDTEIGELCSVPNLGLCSELVRAMFPSWGHRLQMNVFGNMSPLWRESKSA